MTSGRPNHESELGRADGALDPYNAHHIAETLFKAFGRALRMAAEPDPRMQGIMPSTKGTL